MSGRAAIRGGLRWLGLSFTTLGLLLLFKGVWALVGI